MRPPTDPKHDYWRGYSQAIINARMVFSDWALMFDDPEVRQTVMDLSATIEARAGAKAMLDNARQRNPEWRRKQIKVVK